MAHTVTWLLSRLPRKETLLPNFYQVGVRSLPVVALDAACLRGKCDDDPVLGYELFKRFAEMGFFGIHYPESVGGSELHPMDSLMSTRR